MAMYSENKRKIIITIGLLVALAAEVFYMLRGISRSSPINLSNGISRTQEETSSLLPFGVRLDLSVLSGEKFKILRAPPKVQVAPEELGKSNLFEQE